MENEFRSVKILQEDYLKLREIAFFSGLKQYQVIALGLALAREDPEIFHDANQPLFQSSAK
jgi:hypothetical protein